MDNIFDGDAFGVVRMTTAINELKFKPGRIAELGIFDEEPVDTTIVAVEKRGDVLVLVPPTPRGGPGTTVDTDKRDLRNFTVPHFEINGAIKAEEVQNVRAFGSDSGQLEALVDKIARREMQFSQSMEATHEYSRIGALKGVITYADSTTLDLFSEFGVSQESEIDFDLDNASPASGALRKKCAGAVRTMANNLDGTPWSGLARGFCGDDFFDDLLGHPEVRETYKGWTEAQILREGYIESTGKSYGAFEFGGIVWENYRGSVGGQAYVHTDKCHIFPMDAPMLFKSFFAPADYEETVNTPGERLYAKQYPMPNGKGRHLDVQMNVLDICSRPKTLLKGKRT